jgi:hypothetical protein
MKTFLKHEFEYVLYVKLQSAEQWWSDGYKVKKDGIQLYEQQKKKNN